MIKNTLYIIFLFFFFFSGCSRNGEEQIVQQDENKSAEEEEPGPLVRESQPSISTEAILPDNLDFSTNTTQKQLKDIYEEPLEIKKEKVKNIHDESVIDTRITYIYDGFSFMFYHAAQKDETSLVLMRIEKQVFQLNRGIGVGAALEEITDAFGKPNMVVENSVVYFTPRKVVEFKMKSKKVDAVLISINTL